MMSAAMEMGERLTCPLPAASLRDWMMTLTVSIGWMTEVAMQPEKEPTRKGFSSIINRFYLGLLSLDMRLRLYSNQDSILIIYS